MTNTWIKRNFRSYGLTQHPPGQHLGSLQAQFGGQVVLCIDVSGSMSGRPLEEAVIGARQFVDEALDASYDVAVLLWSDKVDSVTDLSSNAGDLHAFLDRAGIHGGTILCPALLHSERLLSRGSTKQDRVVAIFSDGGYSDRDAAIRQAERMRDQNIRIVARGLGNAAGEALDLIASPEAGSSERVHSVDDVANAVAGLATRLKRA